MEQDTPKSSGMTVGLDLGDRYTQLCMLDEAGEELEEGRLRTTPAAMQRRFSEMDPARVALEVGTHSQWVSRILSQLGHEILVANPRKLRMIFPMGRCRSHPWDLARLMVLPRRARAPPAGPPGRVENPEHLLSF